MEERNRKLEGGILIAVALTVLFVAIAQQILAIVIAIAALFILGVYKFFQGDQL